MSNQQEKVLEMLPTEERSNCDENAQLACAPEAPRNLAQQRLHFERDRLRSLESTLTELMTELVSELASSESRLQQLENDLGVRDEQVDELRAQLEFMNLPAGHFADDSSAGPARSSLPHDDLEQKLAATEFALLESQNEQQEVRGQLAKAHKQLNLRAQELNDLRAQLVEVSMSSGDAKASNAADSHELLDLRSERQLLIQRLAEAEGHLQQFAQVDLSEIDNLRRRFEMAVQDVRELKVKNSQLESELAKSKSGKSSTKTATPAEGCDWESRKKMLISQLESEFDEEDPQQRQEKLTVESTIRITDEVIAQKERDMQELRKLLEERSGGMSEHQLHNSAIAAVLDKDELIAHARERMTKLEAEWSEKQRRAEVEISLERAKLARERSLVDERIRAFEKERLLVAVTNSDAAENGKPAAKPTKGGNWLARLGLKDERKSQ